MFEGSKGKMKDKRVGSQGEQATQEWLVGVLMGHMQGRHGVSCDL